jgi:hypothetical protein
MIQYIEKFTQNLLFDYLLTLQQIITALQNEESIKPELFNSFMSLIKYISIIDNTIIYTSEQYDINNQIKLLEGKLLSSLLFTNYIIKVVPLYILPTYKPLYIKLLNQIVQNYIILYDQIINVHILATIINEILSVDIPQTDTIVDIPQTDTIVDIPQTDIIVDIPQSESLNKSTTKLNNRILYFLFILIIVIIIIIFIILYYIDKRKIINLYYLGET